MNRAVLFVGGVAGVTAIVWWATSRSDGPSLTPDQVAAVRSAAQPTLPQRPHALLNQALSDYEAAGTPACWSEDDHNPDDPRFVKAVATYLDWAKAGGGLERGLPLAKIGLRLSRHFGVMRCALQTLRKQAGPSAFEPAWYAVKRLLGEGDTLMHFEAAMRMHEAIIESQQLGEDHDATRVAVPPDVPAAQQAFIRLLAQDAVRYEGPWVMKAVHQLVSLGSAPTPAEVLAVLDAAEATRLSAQVLRGGLARVQPRAARE